MLIVLQAHCLKFYLSRNRAGHHVPSTATLPVLGGVPPLRKGILRLAHRRLAVLGIALAGGAAVAAFSAHHMMHRLEVAAATAPLTPAPLPPSAPPAIHQPHHFLANPLHGLASWYGSMWNGRHTASGEAYDESQMTAAHKSLPLGTMVRVTNLNSMRSVIVRINDRGAFAPNRVIDLSSAAAREIGMLNKGLARVSVEVIGRI